MSKMYKLIDYVTLLSLTFLLAVIAVYRRKLRITLCTVHQFPVSLQFLYEV